MSANVGNRAAKELYYKPFAAAVDAGVGSAMCSYNRVNRTWACEEANALAEIHDGSELPGIIRAVAGMSVTVDFNHPLAGHTVTFEVEILSVDDEEKVH